MVKGLVECKAAASYIKDICLLNSKVEIECYIPGVEVANLRVSKGILVCPNPEGGYNLVLSRKAPNVGKVRNLSFYALCYKVSELYARGV